MPKNGPGSHSAHSGNPLLLNLAMVPVPGFVFIVAFFSFGSIVHLGESPVLLLALNTVFLAAAPAAAAFLAAKAYRESGSPTLLLLGSSLLIFSLSAFIAAVVMQYRQDPNMAVTIYNSGFLLSSMVSLAASVMSRLRTTRPGIVVANGKRYILLAYGTSATVMFLIAFLAVTERLPPFFIAGTGSTMLRQIILSLAIVFFLSSAFAFMRIHFRTDIRFPYWYSLSLMLVAEGLMLLMFMKDMGTLANWIGRFYHFLGGVYFFISLLEAFATARKMGISLEEALPVMVGEDALKKAESAVKSGEEKFRLAIDLYPSPFVIYDDQRRIEYANPMAVAESGLTEAQLKGKRDEDLFSPDRVAACLPALQRAFDTAEPQTHEFSLMHPSGTTHTKMTYVPLKNHQGRVEKVFGIQYDLTERRSMEEMLRSARDELETRVKERTEELERANRDLKDFNYIASHDLQEPLRLLITLGDRLASEYRNCETADGRFLIQRIQNSARRAGGLVRDIHKYSMVTSGRERFQISDLGVLFRTAMDDFKEVISEKHAVLEVGKLPVLKVAPLMMTDVFRQLLSNALKFTNEKPPRIIVSARKGHNGMFHRISAKDNGIGFDEVFMDKIFTPFQRLHGRSRFEGSGMGLAICRKILEHHGGRITARSELGNGSEFIIILPTGRGS